MGEVYNIGGGQELANIELARLILDEFNLDSEQIEFVTDRLGHDFRYSVSTSKIEKELAYRPKISFVDGIRSTIDFYRKNPSWWQGSF